MRHSTLDRYPLEGRWRVVEVESVEGDGPKMLKFKICDSCGHWDRRVNVPKCPCCIRKHHPKVEQDAAVAAPPIRVKPPVPIRRPFAPVGSPAGRRLAADITRATREAQANLEAAVAAQRAEEEVARARSAAESQATTGQSSEFTYSKTEGWS